MKTIKFKSFFTVLAVLGFFCLGIALAQRARAGVPGGGAGDFNPAGDSEENQCLTPFNIDLNEFWGVSEQIVGPTPCGRVVNTGEFYIPLSAWFVNSAEGIGEECFPNGSALCYPEGYVPQGTPIEDFLSKIETVTYVVDGKKTYIYQAEDIVRVKYNPNPNVSPIFPLAAMLAKLPPLPPGSHIVEIYWLLTERHCDGFSTESVSCLEGGVPLPQPPRRFDVVPGAAQSN
jgi:hypothetical protein